MASDANNDQASVHLRIPKEAKAEWVERSRADGSKLTDWIARHIDQTANEQLAIDRLSQQIKSYAEVRASAVARGAETPQLAALLIQKYGTGIADAMATIFDDKRAASPLSHLVDSEVEKLDPQWREHARERWAATPADVHSDRA